MTVLELAALVHCRSLVPVEAFYLVKGWVTTTRL